MWLRGLLVLNYALKVLVRPITIYSSGRGGVGSRDKTFLEPRRLAYEEVRVDDDPAFRARLHDLTGRWTVPQILIGDEPIGGYSELRQLDRDGRLDELLAA